MRIFRGWLAMAACGLIALSGCSLKPKLNHSAEYTLDAGATQRLPVDATTVDQTVNVEFDAGETPINVYLVVGNDAARFEDELIAGRKPPIAAAASAEKQAKGTLSAAVPAKETLSVILFN